MAVAGFDTLIDAGVSDNAKTTDTAMVVVAKETL
jgi:hypothetical protein